jgi:hypothetical protein
MNGPGGGMMAPPAGMGMGMAPPKGMPAPSAPLSAGPIPPANGAVPKVDAALPSPRSSDASSAKPVRGVPGELPPISLPTATK